MFKLFRNELMGPIDTGAGGDTLHPMSSMDILDDLMKDETDVIDLTTSKPDKTTDKNEDTDKDIPLTPKNEDEDEDEDEDKDDEDKDKEDEDDELKELEQELEGPPEDKLELMTPARRRDILKDFPELFKKYPYLEVAYYRDQKFTELFPTIKEAEEAVNNLRAFSEFHDKVAGGDIEFVMDGLNKQSPDTFGQLVDNLLPTLAKVNKDAYLHVITNLSKDTVEQMFKEGKSTNNESLTNAAVILHQFLFGTSKWSPKQAFSQNNTPAKSPQDKQAEDELAKRERAFSERKLQAASTDIDSKVSNAIKSTIEHNIDTKKVMTDYIRNVAVNQAVDKVGELMMKDARFRDIINKLWQNAAKKDYAQPELDKIKSACISKARTLLPAVIKSARQDALKGMGKRVSESSDDKPDTTPKKGDSATPQSRGTRSVKVGDGPRPGETSAEYLMRD